MTINQDTIIQAIATLFCLVVAGFLAIMSWLLYHNRPRRIEAVPITPVPQTEIEWVDRAMDTVLTALEQDETVEWRTQYSLVEEAELVAEQYQTRLLDARIHDLLQDLPSPGFPEGLPPRIEKLLDEEAP